MPAKLVTAEGTARITLVNLSQGGARIRLADDGRLTGGILKWTDHEAPIERVWQTGPEVGMRFLSPIEWDWVVATRHWSPHRVGVDVDTAVRPAGGSPEMDRLRHSGARERLARRVLWALLLSAIALAVGLWSNLI
jgi:hypothetical protein